MKVYWTKFALNSLKEIYDYYKVNVSKSVADKIKNSLLLSTRQLETQPFSGTIEILLESVNEEHRFILKGNYKIIYKVQSKRIFITDVFDTRQNPEKIYRNISETDLTVNQPIEQSY